MNLDKVANDVVCPVTKETNNKYDKLIAAPELREVYMKAMCVELGRLVQGYEDTKGTGTIKFVSREEISQIPMDRMVTYARIVVDYCPQKEDPNRVCIAVGGDLMFPLGG